jgi:hypothetical protein
MSVDSDSDGDSTASNTVQDLCLTPEEYEKFRLDPRSYLGLDDDSDEELDIQIVRDERRDQPSTLAPVNSTNVGANVKVTTAADAVLLGNNPTNNGSAAAAFAAASFDPSALLHNSQNEPPLESSLQIAFPTTKVLRNDTNIDDDENDFLMLDDDDADIDSMSCCSHNSTGIVDAATGNPSVDDAPAPLNASMQPLLGTKTVLPPLRDGTAAEVSDFTLLQAPANCSPQTGATVNQNTIPQGAPGQRAPKIAPTLRRRAMTIWNRPIRSLNLQHPKQSVWHN